MLVLPTILLIISISPSSPYPFWT